MYCSEVWKLRKSDENSSAVWERKILRRRLASVNKIACGGSAPIRSLWICVENQMISQKLEEDYNGNNTW
jgi:hypothetical protein